MNSWVVNGKDLIVKGPEYDNYRWVENDKPTETLSEYNEKNGIQSKSATFTLATDKKSVNVVINASGWFCKYKFNYTITADGALLIDAAYNVVPKDARRIGLSLLANLVHEVLAYVHQQLVIALNLEASLELLGNLGTELLLALDSILTERSIKNILVDFACYKTGDFGNSESELSGMCSNFAFLNLEQ